MSSKIYDKELTLRKILNGMKKIHDIVVSTMGPHGGYVWTSNKSGEITNSKDGATVAEAVNTLSDPIENIGADIIKKTAKKMSQMTGDGSTTATKLLFEISKICSSLLISNSKRDIRLALREFQTVFLEELQRITQKISTKDIYKIALLAIDDKEIASLIHEAMNKLQKNSIILVNSSHDNTNKVEITEGFSIDAGVHKDLIHCYSAIEQTENWQISFENPIYILIDGNLNNIEAFHPFIQKIFTQQRPIIIIAHEFSQQVIFYIQQHILHKSIKCKLIVAPGYEKKELILDIASFVNGIILTEQHFTDTESNISINQLGTSDHITITTTSTVISDKNISSSSADSTKQRRKDRIHMLERILNSGVSNFEAEKIKKRIAMFTGGIGHISIADNIPRRLVENAISSAKSSIEYGVTIGAGMDLIQVAEILKKSKFKYKLCYEIIPALYGVTKQIFYNASLSSDMLIAESINTDYKLIPDATQEKLVEATNILGPAEITINAIKLSIDACLQLIATTGSIHTEEKDTQ